MLILEYEKGGVPRKRAQGSTVLDQPGQITPWP